MWAARALEQTSARLRDVVVVFVADLLAEGFFLLAMLKPGQFVALL